MERRKEKRVERGQINHINIDPEITADGNDLIGKEPIDSIDTLAFLKFITMKWMTGCFYF